MSDQQEELFVSILSQDCRVLPSQGFFGVLKRTLPPALQSPIYRGKELSFGAGDAHKAATRQRTDHSIRILLQMLTAGPCFTLCPKDESALEVFEIIHSGCISATPPEALEFDLTEKSPGMNLYLYPQAALAGGSPEAGAEQGKPYPLFLGFVVAKGALEMAHECVRDGLLPLLLDLDETVVKAYPIGKLTREIDCLSKKMQDQPELRECLQREIDLLREDHALMQQFTDNGCVTIGKESMQPRYEEACTGSGSRVLRPVIELPGRFLTRILPDNTETTMVVHIRPGWEKLREFLIGKDAKGRLQAPFKVYVCTTAEREYALEAWRLLDPKGELIPQQLRQQRITTVGRDKSGREKERKNIAAVVGLTADPGALNYLRTAMPLALILDDLVGVWTKQSQEHVLEIEPFSPNAQVAALNCATRHDPSHYHKLAEELLAARECLREMGCGVYQELHQELQHQLESAAPVLLADVERGAAPAKLKCPCVLNHRAKWRERRDAARQERLARRQAGQQSDAVSNSTAAHSRSTARQLGSARPLQSGAEPPAEPAGQEAQSARTPGRRENSSHRVAYENGEVSRGAKAAPPAADALDASSNGVQDPAPASGVELAAVEAENDSKPSALPEKEGQHPSGGKSLAAPQPPPKARRPPPLPSRVRDRPRDMPGGPSITQKASRGGKMPTGHDRAVAQHRHGMDRDALHDDDAAASAAAQLQAASFAEPVNTVEEQPLGLKLTTRHGHSLAERPSAQGSSMEAPAEPPERQDLMKAATAQHEGSAQTSDVIIDIVGNPEDDAEHASATSKASEPASEPESAKAGSESADPEPGAGAAQPEPMEDRGGAAAAPAAVASPSKAGAPVGAGGPRPPSKRRRVQGEEAGPRSKRHGVSSVPDPMGRWRWSVAPASDGAQAQTFSLDAEDAAALAADKAALVSCLQRNVLPQLNFHLKEHVMSKDKVLRQAAREAVDYFQQKKLPRMVQTILRDAQAAMQSEASNSPAAKPGKPPGSPRPKRKKKLASLR